MANEKTEHIPGWPMKKLNTYQFIMANGKIENSIIANKKPNT